MKQLFDVGGQTARIEIDGLSEAAERLIMRRIGNYIDFDFTSELEEELEWEGRRRVGGKKNG
jgi:hypothetical protein